MNSGLFDIEHLRKTYFKLALPMMLSSVVTLLYSIVDTYFIALTQNTELVAGVSICFPVFLIQMAFGNIFGQGGSSVISRQLGAGNIERVKKVSSFCFYAAIFTGIAIGAVLSLFGRGILYSIGADRSTFSYAWDYYIVVSMATPVTLLTFIHSNLIRCEGKAAIAMISSIVGTVVNIGLDPLFIFTFNMGAMGAAAATVIGHAVSIIMLIVYIIKTKSSLSMDPRNIVITGAEFKEIFSVGITAAITNLMQSLSGIILNVFLEPYGAVKIAAMGIAGKIYRVPQLIVTGLSFGAVPLFGYLFGQDNKKKLKELTMFCIKLLLSISIIMTAAILILSPQIIASFMDTGTLVADGALMLRLQIITEPCMAVILLLTVIFQATGQAKQALVMSLSRQGVVFVATLIIGNILFGYFGVLSAQAAADIISLVLAVVLYKNTKAYRASGKFPHSIK